MAIARGGYKFPIDGDPYLQVGNNPAKFWGKWFSVRIRLEDGEIVDLTSAVPTVQLPAKLIREKLSLLKVAPVGAKIDEVGWRRAENIFYLRFYEDEVGIHHLEN